MAAHADDSDHGCQGQRFLATMFLQSHTIAPLIEIHPSAQRCAAIITGRNELIKENNAPEILTVCVVHFTIHRNSSKCARKSNHSVVHFVLFHEFEIVSNHMYGWNTDDDG